MLFKINKSKFFNFSITTFTFKIVLVSENLYLSQIDFELLN
jgi:hypothetical protein